MAGFPVKDAHTKGLKTPLDEAFGGKGHRKGIASVSPARVIGATGHTKPKLSGVRRNVFCLPQQTAYNLK